MNVKLQKMQIEYPISQSIPAELQKLKAKTNGKKFCEFHGISESKFSRFPSEKFLKELELLDYLVQFQEMEKIEQSFG